MVCKSLVPAISGVSEWDLWGHSLTLSDHVKQKLAMCTWFASRVHLRQLIGITDVGAFDFVAVYEMLDDHLRFKHNSCCRSVAERLRVTGTVGHGNARSAVSLHGWRTETSCGKYANKFYATVGVNCCDCCYNILLLLCLLFTWRVIIYHWRTFKVIFL